MKNWPKNYTNWIYYLLIFGLSFSMIIFGYKMFLSGLQSYYVGYYLESWQKKGDLNNQQWIKALEKAQSGIEHYPVKDAFLFEKLGKVYEWGDFLGQNQTVDAILKNSLEAFQQQVNQTPDWPYAWLNFLVIKYRLNEIDERFTEGFDLLMETAKQTPRVNHEIARVFTYIWKDLNIYQQAEIIRKISIVLNINNQNSKKLWQHLQTQKMDNTVCAFLKQQQQLPVYKACL